MIVKSYSTWSWSILVTYDRHQKCRERITKVLKDIGALEHSGQLKGADVRSLNTTLKIVSLVRLEPYQEALLVGVLLASILELDIKKSLLLRSQLNDYSCKRLPKTLSMTKIGEG